MAQKAATLEIPELMQFLRQQLHDLPDEKSGSHGEVQDVRKPLRKNQSFGI